MDFTTGGRMLENANTIADIVYILFSIGGLVLTCLLWLFTLHFSVKASKEDILELQTRVGINEKRQAASERELVLLGSAFDHIKEGLKTVKEDVSEIKEDIKQILGFKKGK